MSHTNPKHLVTEDEIKESLRTIVLNVMNKPIIEPLSYLKLLA